jgi:ADP-ribosylglycohydrolase/protein-tyrosine phosphatase
MPSPIPDSYWVLRGRLLAGEYPGAADPGRARHKLERFLDAGIRTFIDLTEPGELHPYEGVIADLARERGLDCRHLRFPIRDLGVPDANLLGRVLDAIDEEIAAGRPAYVHCWGGIGRTGTIVGCWLVAQGAQPEEAIRRIAALREGTPDGWRPSPETHEQRRVIASTSSARRAQAWLARYHGALLGLAAGDALGTTLEFKRRGSFAPIDDMIGGGPFGLAPGEWTDDTSMALCLAESLVERDGFDAHDQMTRYVRWWREGHWSSNGRCFDIGTTVRAALARFEQTRDPFAGSADPQSAGNGSLMRLAPVPLRYAHRPADAVRYAADSSRTTHAAAEAVDACRYFAALIVGALAGHPKEQLLAPDAPRPHADEPLAPRIAEIAGGSYHTKTADDIRASGYVVHTLEAALWAFNHTESFRDGAILAVNLGEDADTTGAVYGQVAGAYYGVEAIPSDWRARLARANDIADLATRLHDLSITPP